PWTRDVGQMVNTPVDLYDMLEKSLMIDMHKGDGLVRLGDVEDDYNLPYLGDPMWDSPFESLGRQTARSSGEGMGKVGRAEVWDPLLLGAGAIAVAGLFDASLDRKVQQNIN